MSGHAVRQRFMREFKGLSANTRNVAVFIVGSYVLQLVAAIGAGYWLLQRPVDLATGVALATVVVFIATRLRGFNNIVHECSHFAFTKRREDNALLGSFCSSMVLGCFSDYRDEHITHHAHLGDYDKDMDLQGIRDFRLEDPLTRRAIARHILTPVLGLHLPAYLSFNLSARDGRGFRAMKIGLIAAAAAFLLFDPLPALILVWIPFVWVYPAINYWTDCIDHGGIVASDDELDASRNLSVPRQIRAILFPRNDCFHLVHHLFPQVPSQHLEACHRELLSDPEYRAKAVGPDAPADGQSWTRAILRPLRGLRAHRRT
jgi:fatty acid desaturase